MDNNVGIVKSFVLSGLSRGAHRVAKRADEASQKKWEIRRKLVILSPWAFGLFWLFEMFNVFSPSGLLQAASSLLFLGSFVAWLYLWKERRGDASYTRVWTFAKFGLVRVAISMWIWPVPRLLVVPVTLVAAYLFWVKAPKNTDDDDAPES